MGISACTGCALIACAPPIVLFHAVIRKKSFLILQTLASTFFWTLVILLQSVLLRPFASSLFSAASLLPCLAAAVVSEELVRYGCWHIHRRIVRGLSSLAVNTPGTRLRPSDVAALALSQGFGQATAHSIVFCLGWLPLALGNGVFYSDRCPQASFFLSTSVSSLAMFFVLACGAVVSFESFSAGDWRAAAAPAALHLSAALLSLGNLLQGGCVWVLPLQMVLGAVSAVLALCVAVAKSGRQEYSALDADEGLH